MRVPSRGPVALALACLFGPPAFAQNDAGGNDADSVAPVASWDFDGKPEPGVPKTAKLAPGHRPPAYPAFAPKNTAFPFTGSGLTVREADFPSGVLRFGLKDAITLEAWVKVESLAEGGYAYLIGKGRNRKPNFPEKNQNYAMRLRGEGGEAKVSFLFSSAPVDGKPADWHRWTSTRGFSPSSGWHHVAVSFVFGDAKSIRGYVDGKPVPGTWDMGGATDRAPVEDADDLMLGTGFGGGAGNTFRGLMDDATIWRVALAPEVIAGRYQFSPPPPPVVNKATLPRGQILVELCENGMPGTNAWPDEPLAATETYREDAFGFFELPHKYVDTGVRGDRANPLLVRASAVVTLPAGNHRLLLRARGASRLTIDGKTVLTTPFPPPGSDGHNPILGPDKYLNLGPDFRFAPPGNRERAAEFATNGGELVVVLETIVGSYVGKSKRRPELGETVVAWSPSGSESWELLTPTTRKLPYTDAGWATYRTEREARLDAVNAAARQAARDKSADYWNRRRAAANEWLKSTPEVPVPPLAEGFPANNPIDHFLAAKLAKAAADATAAKAGTVDFYRDVKPILDARCADCHAGGKAKGGLRFDDLAAVLKGGKSDGQAVVPGKPADSPLLHRVKSADESDVMPPKGEKLTAEQIRVLETWVKEGAAWPEFPPAARVVTPVSSDLAFLRRVTLDTVGVVPTEAEIKAFVVDTSPNKRERLIDRLLADPRWADNWVGYWQDVLAENPNILNPTLNNTGPFRWWLHESLLDNKPADLFATELLRMKGSVRFGGPAGFEVASQNDVPSAAKGAIVAGAFLGVEMKCARCHDAPAHKSLQRDLFELAALIAQKPVKVPATSSVPLDKIHQEGGRKPLIQVTLKPGTAVEPKWPFGEFVAEDVADTLAESPKDARDRLAALVTAPANERFAQVFVNRVWKRLMGRGIVEPVDDWEKGKATHPELLKWLGREFVRDGYDTKKLAKRIFTSHAYQRATDTSLKGPDPLYAAPAPRRLTAEQVVDSLFAATGKPLRTEEASLDIDGQRDLGNSLNLGFPKRSWMLTSTSNERDRPSLALPRIQAVGDVLQAFGWRASRQEPTSTRDTSPNVLQPAILSNGTMGTWVTRLSDDNGITELALRDQPVEEFVDSLYLRLLTRKPTAEERATYVAYLSEGYADRVREPKPKPAKPRQPVPYVTWTNHLDPEATVVRMREETAARKGDPPTERLSPAWRTRAEDVLWALLNSPEFVFTP